MSSKLLEVLVWITELPMLVEKKSKQTDLNGTPELMSLPINDLSYMGLMDFANNKKVAFKSRTLKIIL